MTSPGIGTGVAILCLIGAAILAYRQDDESESESEITVLVDFESTEEVGEVLDLADEDMVIRDCASIKFRHEALKQTRQNGGQLFVLR